MDNYSKNRSKEELRFIDFENDDIDVDEEKIVCSKKSTWDRINRNIMRNRRKVLIKRYSIACSILLLISVIGYTRFIHSGSGETRWVQIEVPMGAIESVLLADGSTIILNGGSRLTYPEKFSENKREVKLHGEGCFDIVTNSARPFIVDCEGINVQVLGTKFNLKSYSTDGYIEAKLVSGHIKITDTQTNRDISVLPNECITYSRETKVFNKSKFDQPDVFGWMKREYRFESASLAEITKTLERGYGVFFITERKIEDKKVTTSFINEESIADIMKVLKRTFLFEYEMSNNTIIIK